MMSALLKLFRIIFFLTLYFFISMIVVVTAMQATPIGVQILFAFATPIILVTLQEKRRSKIRSVISGQVSERTPPSSPDEAQIRRNIFLNPIERKDDKIRTVNSLQLAADPHSEMQLKLHVDGGPSVPDGHAVAPDFQIKAPKKLSSKASRAGWIPAGGTASVGGRNIGGMVYVGNPPTINKDAYRNKCRTYIDPNLPIAQIGNQPNDEMPSWPSYSDFSPRCRATYLDWLADGRRNPAYNAGYMFLYFYGLERRFFFGEHNEEREEIVQEVQRLRSLYSDTPWVRHCLGTFLDFAALAKPDIIAPIFEKQGWELPTSLKYAIGASIERAENLTADWVLSWLICHPEGRIRTAAMRCREEFIALFRMRFDRRFPDGLKVSKPRKNLTFVYRAASDEFEVSINLTANGKPVPDISGLRKPLEIAQEIADEVMAELEKLSRFLARNPEGRGSVEAHALLPSELWELFPSEEVKQLQTWAEEIVDKSGLVPLHELIERLEGTVSEKISKRQLTSAADALARLGFGLAPDPRFALRSPTHNEPVVLFSLGEAIERLENASDAYRMVLMELALGTFIAHADGRIAEAERKALQDRIAHTDLTDQERRSLRANLEWLLAVPPDLALLRRKLKELDPDSQASMRAALISAAHADGIIHSAEVSHIEKIYKALGLDPSLAYSDLHAGETGTGPRRVRDAQPASPGEAIPAPTSSSAPKLDAARIAAIRSDTARVSSVLGQIFDTEDPETDAPTSKTPEELPGLDAKHGALVLAIIGRPHWSEDEFAQLCAAHSLMPAGALEAVNEWAFDTYDEALLDEYGGYDVSPEISAVLSSKFEAESQNV